MFPKFALLTLGVFILTAAPGAFGIPDAPARLANGALVEGAIVEAQPDGLLVRTPKGEMTYPWRYLSAGTRRRYEHPMRAELQAQAEEEARLEARRQQREAARAKQAAEKAAAQAEKKAAAEAAADKSADDSAQDVSDDSADNPAEPETP